jgi:hypothetical protein
MGSSTVMMCLWVFWLSHWMSRLGRALSLARGAGEEQQALWALHQVHQRRREAQLLGGAHRGGQQTQRQRHAAQGAVGLATIASAVELEREVHREAGAQTLALGRWDHAAHDLFRHRGVEGWRCQLQGPVDADGCWRTGRQQDVGRVPLGGRRHELFEFHSRLRGGARVVVAAQSNTRATPDRR